MEKKRARLLPLPPKSLPEVSRLERAKLILGRALSGMLQILSMKWGRRKERQAKILLDPLCDNFPKRGSATT
jgi:hypothetical protein